MISNAAANLSHSAVHFRLVALSLEKIVVHYAEVVKQLNSEVALGLNVVLARNHAIDLDVNGEAVRGKLRGYLFVDLDEHVV